MNELINYEEFISELKITVYKNSKADLLNKLASKPDRYLGIFRPTSPKLKLIQNITQSHEISFGDFVEEIITKYLGKFYTNLPKSANFNGEPILFDQLFTYDNKVFMIEQKMRDDHDSTKKRGQFENFIKKIEYLKQTYPDKEIEAGMWFVDPTLKKNKNYYSLMINKNSNIGANIHLFYGDEFTSYLDKMSIWDEMTEYLIRWKNSEDNIIELNFEDDWDTTKSELLEHVTKKTWRKLISNRGILNEIFPILFPTKKYIEILEELGIQ